MASPCRKETSIIEDPFVIAREISSLSHFARVQAHEADLKANHALMLAQRAISEAESVHEVAESLACTANTIARMAYEFANRNNPRREEFENDSKLNNNEEMIQDFQNFQIQNLKLPLSNMATEKDYTIESNSGLLLTNTPLSSSEQSPRYTESFPENEEGKDLPKEFDSSHSLPVILEHAYQGPRECKPTPWTEKKTLRKIQRKLKGMGIDECEDDTMNTKSSNSKEKLLQSVRISTCAEMTNELQEECL